MASELRTVGVAAICGGGPEMSTARKLCVLFVDGLGVGEPDPAFNPIAAAEGQLLGVYVGELPVKELPLGGVATGIDASLGVEGIPQSATGQTALFTGVNAAKLLGKHLQGFPNQKLRRVIFERSLLRVARQRGLRAAFVNAYTSFVDGRPFEKLVRRVSASTMACLSAGQPFFTLNDLHRRRALYQEFTNRQLAERGCKVPLWTPEEAGSVLAEVSAKYDLCLYEFFRTDRVGHKRDLGAAADVVRQFERFLRAFLSEADLSCQTVLLVSDHGNIEDVRTGTHTLNRALAAGWGKYAEELIGGINSVLGVYPEILEFLGISDGNRGNIRVNP